MSKFKSQYSKESDPNLASVKLHNVGHEACDPLHTWAGVREFYSIHVVVEGKGYYSVGERDFSLRKGDVFLIYPNTVVQYHADQSEPWEYLWLGVSGVQHFMYLTDFTPENPCIYAKDGIDLLDHLFAVYNAQGSGYASELEMMGLTYVFLSKLMSQGKNPTSARFEEYGKKAKELVDLNYSAYLSTQEVADRLNISRSQLHRNFTKNYGISLGKYINQVRISRSMFLLESGDLSILEISNSVGFENQMYFSSAFKKYTGLTPTAYRKQAKG